MRHFPYENYTKYYTTILEVTTTFRCKIKLFCHIQNIFRIYHSDYRHDKSYGPWTRAHTSGIKHRAAYSYIYIILVINFIIDVYFNY